MMPTWSSKSPSRDQLIRQAEWLGSLCPALAPESCFALKEGTALSVYWFDYPRLSVDLDLVFVPRKSREEFQTLTHEALHRVQSRIRNLYPAATLRTEPLPGSSAAGKVIVAMGPLEVKMEVATVHRETLYPTQVRPVQPQAVPTFGKTSLPLLSFSETCAGKFNAALTRQHPRDLFDVGVILEHAEISPETRTAFAVNLITQPRPFAHMLNPRLKAIPPEALEILTRMTTQPFRALTLPDNLITLQDTLCRRMPAAHQEFLLSFTHGTPDWSLLEVPHAARLPAVRWREQQMSQFTVDRRQELAEGLYRLWPEQRPRFYDFPSERPPPCGAF